MDTNTSTNIGAANHAAITHHLNNQLKPEWLRIPDAVRLFGVCRSSLYELIAAGEIKSTSLRKRGALRGIRIINFDSLAAYCERAASGEEIGKVTIVGNPS